MGDMVFLSGQVSRSADGGFLTGKLGADCDVAAGQEAARACAIHILASAKTITGSLDGIRFLKVLVMVNAAPDFTQHALVAEGFSKCIEDVLGDRGRHARSAVGMGSLPANVRVEVEAILQVTS
jgi:enamine deaminase RidA (YjgF/YER057c/UK114 family)